ncbi:MAG: hypothetical protein ACYTBJ_16020 [Planctomycetota bacterium]|jgi:hypothetical protein
MTDEKKTTTRKRAPKKTAAVARPRRRRSTRPKGVPGHDKEVDNIIEIIEDEDGEAYERVLGFDHDVQVFEEKINKTTKDGSKYAVWQPYGRAVPVLLITHPQSFTTDHEDLLRLEPGVESDQKVIRRILKRHDVEGETFFEMGLTDADSDRVIKYAINFLAAHGVKATRDIRFTTHMDRNSW